MSYVFSQKQEGASSGPSAASDATDDPSIVKRVKGLVQLVQVIRSAGKTDGLFMHYLFTVFGWKNVSDRMNNDTLATLMEFWLASELRALPVEKREEWLAQTTAKVESYVFTGNNRT